MKGWLIVNSYLKQAKYDEIHSLVVEAFRSEGLAIRLFGNAEVGIDTHNAGGVLEVPDYVLYWDKDILLAERLERLGYRVLNCADAISACDNKGLMAVRLADKGFRMPRTIVAPFCYNNIGYNGDYTFLESAAGKLGFPMVVKESFGSFGAQVFLVRDMAQLYERVKKIGTAPFVMQEFIAASFGRDVRAQVVGGKVVASVLRTGAEGDFRANVTAGGSMVDYKINSAFEEMAISACSELKLDFGGVDMLFGEGGEPVLCEVNSNAHFKNLLDATGINTAEILARYIKGL